MKTRNVHLYKYIGIYEMEYVTRGDLFMLAPSDRNDVECTTELFHADSDSQPVLDDPEATTEVMATPIGRMNNHIWEKPSPRTNDTK